ncbi:hypothetical protein CR513_53523, partial [Mucuna pruriens]
MEGFTWRRKKAMKLAIKGDFIALFSQKLDSTKTKINHSRSNNASIHPPQVPTSPYYLHLREDSFTTTQW